MVAKGFNRFFNWGEVQEEMADFDFSDFLVQSKEDGSLVLFYFFDGHWRVNTRGSFAQHEIDCQTFTWEEAICHALDLRSLDELDNWAPKEGIIEMPDLPGLGLNINWDRLDKYRKG